MNKYTESEEPEEFYIQYRRKLEEKVSFIDEKYPTEQIFQLTSLKDRQMNRSFRRNCPSS